MNTYQFTNNWFASTAYPVWEKLIPQIKPTKILEIGSYEGASTCYLIDKLGSNGDIELHCIDTWEGGIENKPGGVAVADMVAVESRFHSNIKKAISKASCDVDLIVHKGFSDIMLSRLFAEGKKNYFDFIYIDGSHQAPDVLCDAVIGFKLLRKGGLMAFDDYLWFENLPNGKDPLRCPKIAIDAFININFNKISIIRAPLYQLYLTKITDD